MVGIIIVYGQNKPGGSSPAGFCYSCKKLRVPPEYVENHEDTDQNDGTDQYIGEPHVIKVDMGTAGRTNRNFVLFGDVRPVFVEKCNFRRWSQPCVFRITRKTEVFEQFFVAPDNQEIAVRNGICLFDKSIFIIKENNFVAVRKYLYKVIKTLFITSFNVLRRNIVTSF